MNDDFDVLLRQALEIGMQETAGVLLSRDVGPQPVPSRRHQRRMRRMLANPLSFARRAARPAWQRTLGRAAAILLVIGLTGAALWSIPSVRAAARRVMKTIYPTHDEYTFSDSPVSALPDLPHLTPEHLPEGYRETDYQNQGTSVWITYEDAEGNVIYFDYLYAQESSSVLIDNEQFSERTVYLEGRRYTIYENGTGDIKSALLWLSDDQTVVYLLYGASAAEQLLDMAQSFAE